MVQHGFASFQLGRIRQTSSVLGCTKRPIRHNGHTDGFEIFGAGNAETSRPERTLAR